MAAPQRRYRATLPTEPALPAWEREPDGRRPARRTRKAPRKTTQGRNLRVAVLVIAPVLLMLGSVYLHTVSGGLEARAEGLRNEVEAARAQGERLEVEVAKLSAADRVRPLAREKLGMRDAGSADLEVFKGGEREDGTSDAGAKKGGGQR
jgi:cell division protein FtsL